MRVPSSQEVAGKWEGHAKGYDVLHNFTPTGDLFVDIAGIGGIPDGKFWFEDDLVKIEDMTGGCENIIPSYEVYATFEGEKATQLRFVLVGEDACSDRYETLAGKTLLSK